MNPDTPAVLSPTFIHIHSSRANQHDQLVTWLFALRLDRRSIQDTVSAASRLDLCTQSLVSHSCSSPYTAVAKARPTSKS